MKKIVKTIQGATATDTWLQAMEYLLTQPDRERYNLTLAVEEPTTITSVEKDVLEAIDAAFVKRKLNPLATVAGTIFPANHYLRSGADGVYEDFPNDFALADKFSWGTYAMRMVRMEGKDGTINPLKTLVKKIKDRPNNYRLFYEMNVGDLNDFDLPIYRTALDYKKFPQQPCLSHLSFKIIYPEEELTLAVMYRSHYYTERALGNLLGLGQLQYFVATEAGLGIGPLVCHSTHARIDTPKGMGLNAIRDLVSKCRSMMEKE